MDYFNELTASLQQAIDYNRGDRRKARTVVRELTVPQFEARDIVVLRQKYALTQKGLATVLGVSPRTVEAWEAGKNKPTGSANKLLYLIQEDATVIERLVSDN